MTVSFEASSSVISTPGSQMRSVGKLRHKGAVTATVPHTTVRWVRMPCAVLTAGLVQKSSFSKDNVESLRKNVAKLNSRSSVGLACELRQQSPPTRKRGCSLSTYPTYEFLRLEQGRVPTRMEVHGAGMGDWKETGFCSEHRLQPELREALTDNVEYPKRHKHGVVGDYPEVAPSQALLRGSSCPDAQPDGTGWQCGKNGSQNYHGPFGANSVGNGVGHFCVKVP